MTINERVLHIYEKCRSAGMTHAGTIGMLGNLQGETSDFDPMSCETMYLNRFGLTDAEYTKRANNGEKVYQNYYFTHDSAGYGIVQWTWWSRKKGLLDYAKAQGKSVGDLDVQIEYMVKELKEQYTAVWKVLSTTTSYYEAVKSCVTGYEKPANQSSAIEKRTAYAKNWYSLINDSGAEQPEPTAPVGDSFDRKKIIALAQEQVGYLEKKNNSQLDDKTANAGSANYTKYARDLDALGNFYNGPKQGFAWCDVFVDWLFVKCFGVENALKLLCQGYKSSGAGCTYSMNYYRAKGQFHTRSEKPQVGDQIFFGSGLNDASHTGIVYMVNDTTVYTIEGNTSGASGVVANGGGVFKKSYARNYLSIIGYGRPAYNDGFVGDSVDESVTTPDDTPKPDTNMPTLKKGDKGTNVKKAQQLLIAKGYSCGSYGADGDFGSGTLTAVNKFRKDNGLTETGIIDNDVWVILLDLKQEEEPKQDEPKEVEATFNPPTLKKGDKGIAVKKLQHLLVDSGISVGSSGTDADFGNGTYNAVKIAQVKAKLPTTGIADKYVWAWLINS